MKKIYTFILILAGAMSLSAQTYASFKSFKDIGLDTFYNGSDLAGEFNDGGLIFPVNYDTTYNIWSGGWAVSTMRDDSTAGFGNLYSVYTGARIDDGPYAIGQNNTYLQFDDRDLEADKVIFEGMYICNTTYATLSMKYGDSFAKKFGGEDGKDPDFFKLRIYARENNQVDSTNFVDFYLADYRFDEDSLDYIVDDWWYVDLTPLGYVEGLSFELSSSDTGQWGMNTPAFFAVDKIKYSFEPDVDKHYSFEYFNIGTDSFWFAKNESEWLKDIFTFESYYDSTYNYWSGGFALSGMRDDVTKGYGNLFSAIAGGSYDGITYAIGQNNSKFYSEAVCACPVVKGIWVCNTTYAYYSMKYGDDFAKKFGGESGDDPDFFKLRIYGIPLDGYPMDYSVDSSRFVDVYLADFRFEDNSKDYILDDWVYVDLEQEFGDDMLGLGFELTSSDTGQWGMNTPAFFAIDKIKYDWKSGTDDKDYSMDLKLYPNPAIDYITIDKSDNYNNAVFMITDMSGKLLRKGIWNENKINVHNLQNGMYIFTLIDGDKMASSRFVKTDKD